MGPSDRVAVEPGGLIGRSRVEPEQALCILVPVLQQRVELAHGLPELTFSVTIETHPHGSIKDVAALLTEIHDLRLGGMCAQGLACEIRELVPHHDGLLTANPIVLVLNCHVLHDRRELIDHLIERIVIDLAVDRKLVFDLRVDVSARNDISASRPLSVVVSLASAW